MKKFLRFLAALIIIIIVAIVSLGLYEPKDVPISRSVVINAPKEAVFEQVVKFKNWPHWSPWYKMDSTAVITYSGIDGQPGSSFHWVGDDKKTGEGEVKNTGVNGTVMNFDFLFEKPHSGSAEGSIKTEDTVGGTKVTWTFSMHIPFPLNAMNAFMNMDKMMGPDFEKGLNHIKSYVETHAGK